VTVDGPAVSLPPLPARDVATYGATPLPPFQPGALPAVFAAAGRSRDGTQAVMFLVNPYAEARAAAIELRGAPQNIVATRAVLLTSESADDENSFESPRKIAPREEPPAAAGPVLQRTLPPYSLTVLSFSIRP
jgi:alpha-N-arabinofuranosidase